MKTKKLTAVVVVGILLITTFTGVAINNQIKAFEIKEELTINPF